jgi:hypothetical protein
MSIFIRTISLALFSAVLFACNKATDPKEVSVQFIEHLNAHKFDEAAALATEGTKAAVVALKAETPAASPASTGTESAQAVFATDALQPYISGKSAIVKNDVVTLNLEKVDGDWQVVASKEVIDNIVHRTERIAQAKTQWETLQKEYMNRMVLLREYISYIKSTGRDMPEVLALEEGLKKVPTISAEPTKEEILAFVQGQQVIDGLADKALQPTLTASADLTMNYIINVQSQASRIGEAKTAYNKAAAAASSSVYTVVP